MTALAKMEMKDIAGSIALICTLFGLAIYLPFLGFFFALFIPLPVLYTQCKRGQHYGAIVSAISVIAVLVMIGGIGPDLLFFAELLLMGILLGTLFEKHFPLEAIVVFTCLTVLITGGVGMVLYSLSLGQGATGLVSAFITRSLELTMALYKNAGLPEESVQLLSNSLNEIQYVLLRISPALITAMTLFIIWANILTARPLFIAAGLVYPEFGSLNRWRAPESLVWVVIGCGIILVLPFGGLRMVGLNGLIIMLTIYFFQGIAVVSFFFNHKHFPRIARIFIYSLIFLQQFLLMLVVACGFFDTWFDFRKLSLKLEPPPDNNNE